MGEREGPGVEAGLLCLEAEAGAAGGSTHATLRAGLAALPKRGLSFSRAGGLRWAACSLPRASLIQCLKLATVCWWRATTSCK